MTGYTPLPLPVEDARTIAERILPESPQDVANRVRIAAEQPDHLGGRGASVFRALLDIAKAREAGWDWRAAGAVKVDSSLPSEPPMASLVPIELNEPVTLPWWIVVALANAWVGFAIIGKYKSLDEAFEVKSKPKQETFARRQNEFLVRAKRAVQVAGLMQSKGMSETKAIDAVAYACEVSYRTVSDNFREHRIGLGQHFPTVAEANRRKSLRGSDPEQ